MSNPKTVYCVAWPSSPLAGAMLSEKGTHSIPERPSITIAETIAEAILKQLKIHNVKNGLNHGMPILVKGFIENKIITFDEVIGEWSGPNFFSSWATAFKHLIRF